MASGSIINEPNTARSASTLAGILRAGTSSSLIAIHWRWWQKTAKPKGGLAVKQLLFST
jgi:hypothetical protein